MSDYEKLTNDELAAEVAERLMCFEVRRGIATPGGPWFAMGKTVNGVFHSQGIPHYSTDDNAVRLVRDRIAELGLTQQFIEVFLKQESHPPSMLNVMQQTPREQCIAALMALEAQQ